MTPKAGIVRAFLIAGIAVGLVFALMWVADSMVERIETTSASPSPPPASRAASRANAAVERLRAEAPGEALPMPELPQAEVAPITREDVEWYTVMDAWGGLPVNVVDEGRAPVVGALLGVPKGDVWPLPVTDENGFAIVSVEGPRPTRLSVRAFGYERAEVEVPQAIDGPLLIVLRATSGVRVRVVTGTPEWLDGLFVGLSSHDELFVERAFGDDFLGYEGGWEPRAIHGSSAGSMATYALDESGLLELDRLQPGSRIEVAVVDRYGNELAREPVPERPPAAIQEVVVVVPGAPHDFDGRVVDEAGQAVESIRVGIDGPGLEFGDGRLFLPQERRKVDTDADGRFSFTGVWMDSGTVTLQPPADPQKFRVPGTQAHRVHENVDLRSAPTFVLHATRDFDLFLRDSSGDGVLVRSFMPSRAIEVEPVESSAVEVVASIQSEPHVPGQFHVEGAPSAACRVRAMVAGRVYEGTIGPEETEIVLTLPAHGALKVGVVGAPGGVACTPCRIRVRRTEDGFEHVRSTSEAPSGGRAPVQFTPLLPGDYEVWLERLDPGIERQPVSARVPVAVTPGETTSIDVALLD